MNISIKKLFRIVLIASVCFLSVNLANAQRYRDRSNQNSNDPSYDNPDSLAHQSFADRLVKGTYVDFGIGPTSYITLSPILGYRITPKLQAGIGLTYSYLNSQLYDINGNVVGHYQETDYGGRLYAEYDFAKNVLSRNSRIFAHAEMENLNVAYQDPYTLGIDRIWVPSPYVGLGIRDPLGKNVFASFTLLVNVNYTAYQLYNPYGFLVYRIGITF